MEYDVLVTRGSDNVSSTVVRADGDDQALAAAKNWASSLGLDADDKAVLSVKLQDGRLKTFLRRDF